MKIFTRRDSATAALRKLGIDKKDYSKFIATDGPDFLVDLDYAQKFLLKPVLKPLDVTKSRDGSMAQFMRTRIVEGADNLTILAETIEKFPGFDAKKHKTYPSWYRCQLNRGEGRMKY